MKIKVAHCDIEVASLTPRHAADAEALGMYYGEAEKRIVIQETLPPAEQARVLIHELIHAIYDCHHLASRDRGEEAVCLALDVPLAIVIRDNPHLLVALTDALCHGKPLVGPQGSPRKPSRR